MDHSQGYRWRKLRPRIRRLSGRSEGRVPPATRMRLWLTHLGRNRGGTDCFDGDRRFQLERVAVQPDFIFGDRGGAAVLHLANGWRRVDGKHRMYPGDRVQQYSIG